MSAYKPIRPAALITPVFAKVGSAFWGEGRGGGGRKPARISQAKYKPISGSSIVDIKLLRP